MKLHLLTIIGCLFAFNLLGQIEVEGTFKLQPLAKVIDQLEKKYNLTFNYNPTLIADIQVNTTLKKPSSLT